MLRPAAVAGRFYPGESAVLRAEVEALLAAAPPTAAAPPKVLIAPHAGYIYSGPIAARAYARIAPLRGRVRRVVLLGPSHFVGLRGLAAPTVAAFETPLGRIPIDRAAIASLADLKAVFSDDRPHAREHSLEVHLPFLQVALGGFELVPFAVGETPPAVVARVIGRLWGGPETLIVISTDLSHYHPYGEAQAIDANTAARIAAYATDLRGEECCGCRPLNGLMLLARQRGLAIETIDLRNSGDTAGDRSRVVGYGAWSLTERSGAPQPTDADTRALLLGLARSTLEAAVRGGEPRVPESATLPAALHADGACFVTLMKRGALRGCIGSLEPHRPLWRDVMANAVAAGLRDPRFPRVVPDELAELQLSISLLTPRVPFEVADRAALLATLVPQRDGLVIIEGDKRATFLPKVWDQLPDPRHFVEHLMVKAGLTADHWSPTLRFERYASEDFGE